MKCIRFSLLTLSLITAGTMLGMQSIEQKLANAGAHQKKIVTSQGNISVWDTQGNGQPIVFIHGNSASGKIFLKQFETLGKKNRSYHSIQLEALGKQYRLIAIDLPGHGSSDTAKDSATYGFPGYAKVISEVLQKLNVKNPIVVGWSLGGHVALELSLLMPNIKGILITGTPPIALSQEGMQKGFKPVKEIMGLLGYPDQFNEQQAKQFMGLGGINMESPETQFITQDAINTKGEARQHMVGNMMKGLGADETKIVAEMRIPLAIVAGENDAGINNDYIMNQVKYNSLWNNKVNVIKNAGHAVFWENADEFNKILDEFVQSLK